MTQVIFFHRLAAQDKTCFFRLVEIQDPLSGRLVFLTNHLDFGATTIAAVYKERWQIELFFKALKQNLRVKTFRRHLGQRPQDPNLDSIDRSADSEVSAAQSNL